VALSCLHAAQRIDDGFVGHDDSAVGNCDRHRVGVVDVILFPAPLVVPVDGELQVYGYPHAWQPIEEATDHFPTPSWIVQVEAARQLPDGKCVLLEYTDQQFEVLVNDFTCLDPDPQLSGIRRRGIDEQADELPFPFQSVATHFNGRLGLVPVLVAQQPELLITGTCHHLALETLRGPDPHLTRKLVRVDDLAVSVVDLENPLDPLECPMHTHSERIELLGPEGRSTELLVHRYEELVAEKIPARPDRPEV
jgi:hypothetical protein